jgi:hypothetical protein
VAFLIPHLTFTTMFKFILFLFFPLLLAAQEVDYLFYNKKIQQAEWYLVQGKHKKALKVYKKLYPMYDKTFVKDDINAMTCALLCRDYESAVYFDKRRIQKNVPLREKTEKLLKKYYASSAYQQAKPALAKLQAYGENIRKSNNLAHLYDSLETINEKLSNYFEDTLAKDSLIYEQNRQQEIALYQSAVQLLKTKGYPDDLQRGTIEYDNRLLFSKQYYFHTLNIFAKNIDKFDKLTKKALYQETVKGNIDWEFYISFLEIYKKETIYLAKDYITGEQKQEADLTTAYYVGLIALFKQTKEIYTLELKGKKLRQFNRNRRKLGFGNLKESREKYIFTTNDEYFYFHVIKHYVTDLPFRLLNKEYKKIPSHLLGKKFRKENGIK